MNRATVLVVGKNEFLNTSNEWDIVAALNTEAAIEKFHQIDFDVVVFSNDIRQDEIKLKKLFLFQRPEIIFLQNENDNLLFNQIKAALETTAKENKPSFSIVDDALKNAMLPITIQ